MPIPQGLTPTPFSSRFPSDVVEWIDIYGFAVPAFISDPAEEYTAIRNRVAALEFSMLYKWDLRGPGAIDAADAVFSRNVRKLGARRIAYGVVVDERGMMVDDVTAVVLANDHVRVIGGNPQTARMLEERAPTGTTLEEVRDTLAVLSLQGPRSREVLAKLTAADVSNDAFPYYTFVPDMHVAGIEAHVNRMGFTAELGYEIMVPVDRAEELWDAVFAAGAEFGIASASAAALMMCRVEAGMIMGELEYDNTVSPFECRMGWAIDLEKGDFVGRDALLAAREAVTGRVVSLAFDRDVGDVDGSRVTIDDQDLGFVTMGVPSPVMGGNTLALARVHKDAAKIGTKVVVAGHTALVHRTPAFDPDRLRVRS